MFIPKLISVHGYHIKVSVLKFGFGKVLQCTEKGIYMQMYYRATGSFLMEFAF